MEGDGFMAGLRAVMKKWGWADWQIDEARPIFLRACEEVGIVVRRNGGLEVTGLAEDEEAWARVWRALDDSGIAHRADAS